MSVKRILNSEWILMILLMFGLIVFIPVSVQAETEQGIKVFVNGERTVFDSPPIIENGRTMMPLRAIVEAMGVEVKWNGKLQEIILDKNGEDGLIQIILHIGSSNATVQRNGETSLLALDAPPFIQDDRTLLPLRFLSESMGLKVQWEENTRTVYITSGNENDTVPLPEIEVSTIKMGSSTDIIESSLIIPVISGMADQDRQEEINRFIRNEALQFNNELTAMAKQDYEQMAEEYFRQYSAYTDYAVMYNQNGILSLTIDYYSYTGGAHGMTNRIPYTIDVSSGKMMSLEDLFKEKYDYLAPINTAIKAKMQQEPDIYFAEDITGFKTISSEQKFYLDEQRGLVIFFDLYEIAPYAAGFPEFVVPLSSFGEGLNEYLR